MGGSIWVESKPGSGSTFYFTAWFGLGTLAPPLIKVPEAMNGLRVLVADDNAGVREVLAEALEQYPFRVETVAGAVAAIEAVKNADAADPFAVVLMDWQMPEMDGIEAVRSIKGDGGLGRPPAIIMVTAFGHDEVRQEAEQAGVDGLIVKPISQAMLLDAVLAAASPQSAHVVPAAAPERDYGLQGARVLLVEDIDINRQIAVELLRNVGIEVATANNGREALSMLDGGQEDGRHFDLVLMDLQMPEMDGFEATRLIRADERFRHLPIIAMTAHAMIEERERCLSIGMNDHLSKPIEPEVLYQTLARWHRCGAGAEFAVSLDAVQPDGTHAPRIPQVQGIDTAGGLRRVAGNATLYASLLQQFRAGQADAADRIRGGLMSGDRALAERVAHTLKGVAANLGASEVRDAAAAVEQAIRQGYNLDHIAEPLGRMEGLLDDLMGRLADALPQPVSARTEPATQAENSDLQATLKRLAAYLADNDGEAVNFLEANRDRLRGAFLTADYARFETAVRSFEFDTALEQLSEVVQAAEIAI